MSGIKRIGLLVCVFLLLISPRAKAQGVVYSSNIHAGKKIALTFDDGPHPKITPEILKTLEKYSVRATFFIIGVNAKYYPDTLKMIVEAGHEIGNHTYSHNILKSVPKDKIEKEIVDTEKQISSVCDLHTALIRPPCGKYDKTLEEVAKENGYKIVLWTVDTKDWSHSSAQSMIAQVTKNVKDGDIILFHDYVSGEHNTVKALEKIIPLLLEKGYEFVTVSELLQ